MVNQPFDQNRTRPDEQAFFRGEPIDAGTTGPYAPANTDPSSYRNQFVSQLKKNPPSSGFYQQVFSSQDAQAAQSRIDALSGSSSTFANQGDNDLAKDFLTKYLQGGQRGLVPQDQLITQSTIAAFQSQQPGQGINDGNVTAAGKMNYPGKSGTQVS